MSRILNKSKAQQNPVTRVNTHEFYIGKPYPLGATWDGNGVNFALYAENAEGIDLCLFSSLEDDVETIKLRFMERTHHVWHMYVLQTGRGPPIQCL
jgi:pullulanase/glycogen debranching enzyme